MTTVPAREDPTDPEVVVAEFTYRWHSQEPLSVGCVFVVRVRDGTIVESRDDIDPVARLVASSGSLRRILMRRSKTWV